MNQQETNKLFKDYVNQIKAAGVPYSVIYKALGISQMQFLNLRKGRDNVKYSYISTIRTSFSRIITSQIDERKKITVSSGTLAQIPLYNVDVMAGSFNSLLATEPQNEYITSHINTPNFNDGKFAVTVYGDSATPKYNGGDIVILADRVGNEGEIEFGRFYVVVTKTSRYIKKVMPGKKESRLELQSENTNYPPMVVNKHNIVALFKVLGKIEREGL
jgi:phage repressor protein C with HTH and peptisase S24 domain